MRSGIEHGLALGVGRFNGVTLGAASVAGDRVDRPDPSLPPRLRVDWPRV